MQSGSDAPTTNRPDSHVRRDPPRAADTPDRYRVDAPVDARAEWNGSTYVLRREQLLDCPLDRVVDFFECSENLEAITPPYLNFQILTPTPVAMHDGARIDYRVRLYGLPMRWRSRIEAYEPGRGFTDVAERSPYSTWVHRHEFRAQGRHTLVTDRVEYALPLGFLGRIAHALFVRRTLTNIFAFRVARVRELLEAPDGARGTRT